jgi:hypothetical protein
METFQDTKEKLDLNLKPLPTAQELIEKHDIDVNRVKGTPYFNYSFRIGKKDYKCNYPYKGKYAKRTATEAALRDVVQMGYLV